MTTGNHSSPFEGHGVRQVFPRDALQIIWAAAKAQSVNPEIVIFPSEMESPWICFNLGARKFGIWKETMDLYEADEHGAMGEDPITLKSLWRA
jgi:hypothetical protein